MAHKSKGHEGEGANVDLLFSDSRGGYIPQAVPGFETVVWTRVMSVQPYSGRRQRPCV